MGTQRARLTRYQFKVLVALAKLGGRNVYSAEFMSAAGVPSPGTATKALRRLVADSLVFVHDEEHFARDILHKAFHELYQPVCVEHAVEYQPRLLPPLQVS